MADDFTERTLTGDDLPAVVALAGRCLATDGGMPLVAEEWFVRRRYGDAARATLGLFSGTDLVGSAAVYGLPDREPHRLAVVGQVDPGWRARGMGGRLLDWALAQAGDESTRVETESRTDAVHALFRSRSLTEFWSELVMRIPLTGLPDVPLPPGTAFVAWSDDLADRFHATYLRGFSDRLMGPGVERDDWVGDFARGEDFRPAWSLLATVDGVDAGFHTGSAENGDGWTVQVAVAPEFRGRGLGAALLVAALKRMAADGARYSWLDVNTNNPGAIRVYQRIGYDTVGIRSRYERVP